MAEVRSVPNRVLGVSARLEKQAMFVEVLSPSSRRELCGAMLNLKERLRRNTFENV